MNGQRFVIIGGGVAGASAAETLRAEGFDGEIQLLGAENRPPYNRPPLSKTYLRGEEQFEQALAKPANWYAEHQVALRTATPAAAVNPRQKQVTLGSGEALSYDKLLFATGGRNRKLPVPGADLDGLLQLRTVADCDRIRARAKPGQRVVVVGLGFIGCEVTASLRQLGVQVAAIEGASAPLARVLGAEVGGVLGAIHHEHGVELVLGDGVAAFEGAGRIERVRTRQGRELACDWVIVGAGIQPNVELLAEAGAAIENGVLADERCRSSLPDIYAAGDVANTLHPLFGRIRVEHWNNGYHQGQAAARAMLGSTAPYDYLHSFWSDQYEHSIQYVGYAATWDRLVFRGSLASRRFLGFYLKDGVVQAAMGLDRGGDPEDPKGEGELKQAADLIRHRLRVSPEQLADDQVPLARLATAGVA